MTSTRPSSSRSHEPIRDLGRPHAHQERGGSGHRSGVSARAQPQRSRQPASSIVETIELILPSAPLADDLDLAEGLDGLAQPCFRTSA